MSRTRASRAERVSALDWASLADRLDHSGFATTPVLLDPAECRALAGLYGQADRFRSRVVMERHGFGRGEYKYFAYPLPPLVAAMREAFYAELAPLANRWREALGEEGLFPSKLERFLAECHEAGQLRPTPLMLKYGPGDYNRLHQDLYGDLVFPLQLTILLSAPGQDFEGGEFVLSEQRPRSQSRVEVVRLKQGQAVIFAVHHRPMRGTRGFFRVNLRHGVSTLHRGARLTLGIIFHDAA
jgi:uncharacterized protein